jgi:hypothetical protein
MCFSDLVCSLQVHTEPLPSSNKGKERETPREVSHDEDLIDFSSLDTCKSSNKTQFPDFFNSLDEEGVATSYVTTARDSTPPNTNPFSDQYRSPASLNSETPRAYTPQTDPLNSPPYSSNNNHISFKEDIAAALKLQFEWEDAPPQRSHDYDPPLGPGPSQHNQLDADFLAAQRLQAKFDDEAQEQALYVHQIQKAEEQLSTDLEHDLAEARRLASQWEAQDETTQREVNLWQEKLQQEDQQISAQAAFAKEVLRAEEEREESITRDMAAAMAAQMQWEAEALEIEDQARQAAEEAERREEEERRRFAAEMAERERRARLERERIAREEAKRRAEEERKRKMLDCSVCMEEGERTAMCVLACGHGYCGGCVVGLFPLPILITCPFYKKKPNLTKEKYRSNKISN